MIKGPDGAPIAGAKVWVTNDDCSWAKQGMSGADGKYLIEEIAPGEHRVFVEVSHFSVLPRRIKIPEASTLALDLELSACGNEIPCKPRAAVNGTLLDSEGRPVTDAAITVSGSSPFPRTAVTSAEGRFGFCELRVGSLQLEVKREGFHPATFRISLKAGDFKHEKITPKAKASKQPAENVAATPAKP